MRQNFIKPQWLKTKLFLLIFFASIILLGCSKNTCENLNCNDNNLCTLDSCDEETGQCNNQFTQCPNEQSCNPLTGNCEITEKCKNIVCDDNDPCTIESCNQSTGVCETIDNVCSPKKEYDTASEESPAAKIENQSKVDTNKAPETDTAMAMKVLSETCDKRNYKIAFVLLTQNSADKDELNRISKIKERVVEDFRYATENLASIDTSYPTIVIKYDSVGFDKSTGYYNSADLGKEFYSSNPDDFDFIAVYHDTKLFGNINFEKIIYPLEGIQNKAVPKGGEPDKNEDARGFIDYYDQSRYYGSNHKLLGILRLGSVRDRFEGIETEGEIIRGRSSGFLHEFGHFWCCIIGDPYTVQDGKLKIVDYLTHWNPYFDHGPDPLAIHSSRTYWTEENDGTFSSSTDFESNKVMYHPFILYFMGLKKPEEISKKFKVITPDGAEWFDDDNKKVFIKGSVDYVSIQDVIDLIGPRTCRFK